MIDHFVEIGNAIWAWSGKEDNQSRAVAIATVAGTIIAVLGSVLGGLWIVIRLFFPQRTQLPAQLPIATGELLSMDQHLTILQKREDQLEAKLSTAHQDEKDLLRRQIADLKAKIAEPEESLDEARKRIADLEALLDREGNHIGGDRITAAKAALERGDYSIADDIFAEIEARNELAVAESARAAYGRGEVAEAEVRWHNALYKRASDLLETFDHLAAYARMKWRLAKGDEAVEVHKRLVEWERSEHGDGGAEYATQINNLASVMQAQGRSAEAEGLYREALEIDRATIVTGHPNYAIRLSNLGRLLGETGRAGEGRAMQERALAIFCETLPLDHPHIAEVQRRIDALAAP